MDTANLEEPKTEDQGGSREQVPNLSKLIAFLNFSYIFDFLPTNTVTPESDPKDGIIENRVDFNLFQSAEDDSREEARREAKNKAPNTAFRWVHIPVNDTDLVQLSDTWEHRVRPTLSVPEYSVPAHAWYMEPSFQVQGEDKTTFALFLPYLNWDIFKNLKWFGGTLCESPSPSRHLRRTLDQFFYSGLQNTKVRDAQQTVSKWTGRSPGVGTDGRTEAASDSLVVMVDQLWVWLVQDASVPTLISCFPSDDFEHQKHPTGQSTFTGIMRSIVRDFSPIADVYDLTGSLVMHSITNIFKDENSKFGDLVAIYRLAIGIKAARHTEKLESFSERQSSRNREHPAAEGTDELKLILEIADILDELNMLLLILEKQARVLASLQTNFHRLKPSDRKAKEGVDQREILVTNSTLHNVIIRNGASRIGFDHSDLHGLEILGEERMSTIDVLHIGGNAGVLLQQAEQKLRLEQSNTERLQADAAQTHKLLLELLNLEQTAASLKEARDTTKQGKAVMLFTIVTIIFLPLSFFTSYFGQNVSEITGDANNPTSGELWKIAGPISVVVIIFALLVAFFIMFPCKEWKKREHQQAQPRAGHHVQV
ncbi:uncharacterized protein NECHADRAFT_86622 [Fusarium vanettenii 77-13-4]|uniref:Uncharacterized protein n=1 Tax=Fusarium vanettenii (strain ATCC MYA-4622 / CBS 123669 / FGSC 9596 / NRRL 45880 / 77-13-4) TaxID=660122 RepID=C7ZG08_FUSV7|nr:uncharacterized protein NECHADRAFT_86622 [Fusarium vanettenii 77-13-4]EEU37071.1 predicted protein [Fusarium vanettenii 77-13-4]